MNDLSIDSLKKENSLLLKELAASKMIHTQIARINTEPDLNKALNNTLAETGSFLNAERAYIFIISDTVCVRTHEWCAEGVRSEKSSLQDVPVDKLMYCINILSSGECFLIPDTEILADRNSYVYDIFHRQNVRSIIEAPIMINGELVGFIGVDNAPVDTTELIADSLKVLGTFIGTAVRNNRENERIRVNSEEITNSRNVQHEVLDSITCGVIAYTVDAKELVCVNDEARYIIGCSENDDPLAVFAQFLREAIVPEDRKYVENARHYLQKVGDSYKYSYRAMVHGVTKSINAHLKLLRFENGKEYILCSLLDVTDSVMLTDTLEKERKTYRNALYKNCEFSFFLDLDEGLIHEEFITAHGMNIIHQLGYTVPVSFDKLMDDYIEQMDIQLADESMRPNFTCAGLMKAYRNGVSNAVSEFHNPKTGMYINVSSLLSRDTKTGHIQAAIVAHDVTELRRRERDQNIRLEAANRLLSRENGEMNARIDAILNGISGGLKIADSDDDFRYVYISEGAAQLQGYNADEFMGIFGRRVTDNICEEDGEAALAEAKRQMAEQGFYSVKYRVPHKDGSIRWVIDRGKAVTDRTSKRVYWYILMQDVTELEERNTQLGNVLSMQEEMSESLSSGFFAYTLPEREILIINQEARRLFNMIGVRIDNISHDLMDRVDEADIEIVRQAVSNLKEVGDKAVYTYHSTCTDGRKIAIHSESKLLSFASGQRYILSSISDITIHELMEKRLEDERRRYRDALAMGCEAMFTVDLTNDEIVSHVFARDGANLTQHIGLELPATYDQLAAAWFGDERIVTDSPEIDIIRSRDKLLEYSRSGKTIIDLEYSVPREGSYRRILALLSQIEGHVNVNFILYNITDARQDEKQRRNIIEALGNIYSGLFVFKLNDSTYEVIKSSGDLRMDIPKEGDLADFVDVYSREYVEPEFSEDVRKFLDPETLGSRFEKTNHITVDFRRKVIGWCRVSLVACDRDLDGKITTVVYAGYVIEEQKKKEMAQQAALQAAFESANIANSAKTEFLANMSHDIRTPMNAIIGMTAIAGTHIDDKERVTDCLAKITTSSKHLLGIINEVLDMSKIESGKIDLQETEFNLAELIDNLLTMSKPEVAAKGHELLVSLRKIEHEYVIGDSQRIQQVFMNLMSNSIKYTPNGGKLSLSISEKATNRPNIGCYEFVFEDNGIGMDEEFQKHLFEPFTRARHDVRVDKIQGTGLGMPITRNIIQMMNGTIKVESKLNVGTKITVNIFLKLWNKDEDVPVERFIDLPVLVCDDDEISCQYTCEMLTELGMKSEWVLTGREAIEKAVERHESGDDFFALIVDWKMPEMDGLETTKHIRERIGSDIPVVIISAYDWSDIEFEARAAGVNAFISKPLFKSRMIHLFSGLVDGGDKSESISDIEIMGSEDYSGKRVLLVEDNEINAEIAAEILEMAGLTIDFAKNGKEAVDMMTGIENGYYDIIFMDIQMPIMNGYEAARAIRELSDGYHKSVPIVAMTANAFAEDVAAAKNAGMNEHIAKPLDFTQLSRSLKKWLT